MTVEARSASPGGEQRKDAGRVDVVDLLRGIAAVAVCWFHFTNGNTGFLPDGWLKSSGTHGHLGVSVFFVISGFVLPYSLHRGGYRSRFFPVFVLKRVIRLDPPYFATIALVILLWWVSSRVPGFAGSAPSMDAYQLMLHAGYLNAIFGQPWLNPVFWTLGIEFQFYLLVAGLFPLLAHRRAALRATMIAVFCGLSLGLPDGAWVFRYLSLFALGVVTFHYRTGMLPFVAYLAALLGIAVVVSETLGSATAVVGFSTALTIGRVNLTPLRPFRWLGDISYSLYLVHSPIGGRVVNLGTRFANSLFPHLTVLAAALAASLVAATIMHRLIERPCIAWSTRLRYKRTAPAVPR